MFELQERGFVVIPGPVPADRMKQLSNAYDAVMATATGDDIRVGSTQTRARVDPLAQHVLAISGVRQ